MPAVHERVTVEGRPGLVLDRVDGPDLLTLLGRRPWLVLSAGKTLGTVHARLHDVAAPAVLPDLKQYVRGRVESSDRVPEHISRFVLAALDDLPDGRHICHGDLYPGNLLVGADGPVVVDWTNATRGDAMADVARTRLRLRRGTLPPGAPFIVRRFHRFGRGAMHHGYLRSYRRTRTIDDELVDRWEPVQAADRLVRGIPGEAAWLVPIMLRHIETV